MQLLTDGKHIQLSQNVKEGSCPPFLTYAGLLCSMSGSDYPPHCLISLSVWAVSSLWWSSLGSWPLAQTTGPVTASSLTSGPPLRPSGWAWPWPSLCLGCREQELIFLLWLETHFCQSLPIICSSFCQRVIHPSIHSFNVTWKVTLANFQTNTLVAPTRRLPLYPCVPLLVRLEQGCCWIRRAWSWQPYPLLVLHSLERKCPDPGWWSLGRGPLDQNKYSRSNQISFYYNRSCC